jgi:flagellar motor switch protein FliM
MSDVMSNDAIAALVDAARRGEVEPTEPNRPVRRPRRVRDIDFTRPTKFTQEQMRRWERGHEAFCRTTGTQLSAELRTPIELEVLNVSQQTWFGAVTEVPQPSLYAVLETSIGSNALLSCETRSVMRLIERMLGSGSPSKPPARELTEIELALTRRMFQAMIPALSRGWEEMLGLSLTLVEIESQPQNLQLAPTSEPTLVVTIEQRTEGASSTMSLLVPHRAIESVADRLGSGHYGEPRDLAVDAETEAALHSALAGINVELRAEVGSLELTIGDVLALQPGDVVALGTPAAAGGTLYADAVPVHRVRPGRSGNRRAIEVLGGTEIR